jgi:hypothetical protein
MSNLGDFFGSHYVPSKRWAPFAEVSGPNVGQTPPEELRVDPFLPVLATDPYDPAGGGGIVIPQGRFVAIGYSRTVGGVGYDTGGTATTVNTSRMSVSDRGKTVLTIHEGQKLTPVGMATNQIYKSADIYSSGNPNQAGPWRDAGSPFSTDSGPSASDVKFRRGFVAEVPYVLSVNNAHGALLAGDRVTSHWGSTTSTSTIAFQHRGKPVKWTPSTLKMQSAAASGVIVLTAAVYPGIVPTITAMFNGATAVTGASTLAYNGANWVATLPSACTVVWYQYGQFPDQIAGEVVRIQSLTDIADNDFLAKFVQFTKGDYLNFPPPASQRVGVTARVNETPTTITAGSVYRLQFYPLSINHAVVIQIKGTVIDKDGVSTTYSADWFTVPAGNGLDLRSSFTGLYHNLNWRTGILEFSANVTVTSIQVTYRSVTDSRFGSVIWGPGVQGLTDGQYITNGAGDASVLVPNNRAGIPPHLNSADVVGAMRVIVAD